MQQTNQDTPVTFSIAKWYGYIFSLIYLLYGSVKIILGFLDRDYERMGELVLFLLFGILLLTICFGFRDKRAWGWYGLVGINGLLIVLTLFGLDQIYNLLILATSIGALGMLFAPTTKSLIFKAG